MVGIKKAFDSRLGSGIGPRFPSRVGNRAFASRERFDSRQGSGIGGNLIPVGKSSFLLGNLKIQGFCDVVFEYYGI